MHGVEQFKHAGGLTMLLLTSTCVYSTPTLVLTGRAVLT